MVVGPLIFAKTDRVEYKEEEEEEKVQRVSLRKNKLKKIQREKYILLPPKYFHREHFFYRQFHDTFCYLQEYFHSQTLGLVLELVLRFTLTPLV